MKIDPIEVPLMFDQGYFVNKKKRILSQLQ